MTWTAKDWLRLGDRFRASRRNAGFGTKEAFAEAVGISSKTYGDIEAGRLGKRTTFSFDTIAQIEDKLDWAPGVSRSILDGREVDPYSGMVLPPQAPAGNPWPRPPVAESEHSTFSWLDERVERLEARMLKVERQLRLRIEGGGDDGPQDQAAQEEKNRPGDAGVVIEDPDDVMTLGVEGSTEPDPRPDARRPHRGRP
jgi:DNA-binding XRE family transcriptional regulator